MAYTLIDDPSAYFQAVLHSSNNSATITNDGNSDLKPDLLWSKSRTATHNHGLYDSTRGVTKFLSSNATSAETTASAGYDLTSFNTDGFSTGNNQYSTICANTGYVAWQWKANGGTTASNSDGSITSTVQADTDAGFSIVTFTSPASSGTGIFSVGHGLGQIPAMVITKSREGTSNWWSWHKGLTGGNSNTSYIVALERITAEGSYSNAWGAGMTSSVFGMQSGNTAVASKDYVAYCFAEKQGYSKFGKYVGNGVTDGAFVYCGFKPAMVIMKRIDSTGSWHLFDNKRLGYNINNNVLLSDTNGAELAGSNYPFVDILSNGFKPRRATYDPNISGATYIFSAFAENPFVTSTGIMGTAR